MPGVREAARTTIPLPVLDLFSRRRMVLVFPILDLAVLTELGRRRVPCVGLDPDPAAVQRARAAGVAAYCGSLDQLESHRGKFDAIYIDVAQAREDFPAHFESLRDALVPGGLLVLSGPGASEITALPPGLGEQWRSEELVVAAHPTAAGFTRCADAIELGRDADLFVDCASVLELGSGTGHFLDALHVRCIAAQGIDGDPDRVRRCASRGLAVTCGDTSAVTGTFDGIYAHHLLERLSSTEAEQLLTLVRAHLTPGGIAALRVQPSALDLEGTLRFAARIGFEVASLEREADDATLVLTAPSAHSAPLLDGVHTAAPVALRPTGRRVDAPLTSLHDLERFERRQFAQGGEDGVLAAVFELVGVKHRSFVEFGCGDGVECNTAALRRDGWTGLLMDGVAQPGEPDLTIHAEWITPQNIESIFTRHRVPHEFDLLSLDLDGNDYWVWRALTHYSPRVVIAEYNANLGPDEALTIPCDPTHRWDGSDFYGASLQALAKLGRAKGYTLVYCNNAGVNAVFVRDDLLPDGFCAAPAADLYRPPHYWYRGYRQTPDLERAMQRV